MKSKKSQITFFIAAGIVLLVLVILLFVGINYANSIDLNLEFSEESIKSYIDACIKQTAENGLILLGKQGGYIFLKDYMEGPNFGISFLLENNENKVPSLEGMENELNTYIESNIDLCLKDFSDFKRQGWSIDVKEIKTETSINLNDVSFKVFLPISISKESSTINLNEFLVSSDVRLQKMHELVNKMADFLIENPDTTNLNTLNEYDFNADVFTFNNKLVYSIEDEKSKIRNVPFKFIFSADS